MVRGLYAAAAGVLTQQKSFNVTSNNIANATTAGFKGQTTVESSFGEHLVNRLSEQENVSKNNIGPGAFMTVNSSEYTDFTQGPLEDTGRAVDLAINGEGFFVVETETFGEVLTRNGQFALNEDKELILPGVGRVLNEGGSPITLESSDFTVSKTGAISVGGEEVDTLYIARKEGEGVSLKSVGNGVYQCESYGQVEPENYTIMQGMVEKSNINMAQEMSKIIVGQNHYQSCTQIIKMYDKINEITVNQIGRIG